MILIGIENPISQDRIFSLTLSISLVDSIMNLNKFELKLLPGYDEWIAAKIRSLSVEALSLKAVTCNACGEIVGTYIIEYDGQTFRLSGEEALTFLAYIIESSQASASSAP